MLLVCESMVRGCNELLSSGKLGVCVQSTILQGAMQKEGTCANRKPGYGKYRHPRNQKGMILLSLVASVDIVMWTPTFFYILRPRYRAHWPY